MIEVKKTGVLFTKTDLEFENEGVLNPVVIREDEWELHGEVNNVVFPTGTALFGSTLFNILWSSKYSNCLRFSEITGIDGGIVDLCW